MGGTACKASEFADTRHIHPIFYIAARRQPPVKSYRAHLTHLINLWGPKCECTMHNMCNADEGSVYINRTVECDKITGHSGGYWFLRSSVSEEGGFFLVGVGPLDGWSWCRWSVVLLAACPGTWLPEVNAIAIQH